MEISQHAIRFPGTRAGFHQAFAAVQHVLDEHGCTGPARFNVELAFEEIAVNIVNHGHPTRDVELTLAFPPGAIVLTFEDDGVRFDPTEQDDPTLPDSIDDARVGGLGLMLVKKFAHTVAYERTAAERNRLTLEIAAH